MRRRDFLLGGAGLASAPFLPSAPAAAAAPGPEAREVLRVGPGEHVLGAADAPVTLIEYASLTCSHCARFHVEVLPEIRRDWIGPGRARLVFRHFPLDRVALDGARLVDRVGADRAMALLDALFRSQDALLAAKDPTALMVRTAALAGMSAEQAAAALADGKLADAILAVRLGAQAKLGVTGTPTFFVNGARMAGAPPYAEFRKVLEVAAKG